MTGHIKRNLSAYFWPEMDVDDSFEHVRTRLACGFSLVIGAAGLLHSALIVTGSNSLSDSALLTSTLICLVYFAVPALWHKTHSLHFTAFALICLFWGHVNYLLMVETSDVWRREVFLLGPPIILMILLGRRMAYIAAGVMSVNLLVLASLKDTFPMEGAVAMIAALYSIVVGLSLFFSEIYQKEQHLKVLRDEEQQADLEKSEFIAKMSHEIRTPLNGLSGVLQLLDDTKLTAEQKELVEVGRNSGRTLMRLINGVLDYSKIAADGIIIEEIPFARSALLTTAFQSQEMATKAKGLKLEMVEDPQLPAWLRGDPTRLNQVITNFISNAIKFSNDGVIRCEILRDGKFAKVLVIDQGIGLTQEAQTRIFNKFEQASSATSRQFGGTGLGLAICKELVELMGGEIGVVSAPLQGSTFWFTFPLVEVDKPAAIIPATAPSKLDLTDKRVLVVEDNKTNQMIVRRFLESMQATVDLVDDGRPALQRCAERRYDIILMDIQLLDVHGVETTEILREGPGPNQNTPIVALSANILPEQTSSYLKAGMNACLGKPYRKDELAKVMSAVLGKASTDAAVAQEADTAAS